jgi:hypothetical protein
MGALSNVECSFANPTLEKTRASIKNNLITIFIYK